MKFILRTAIFLAALTGVRRIPSTPWPTHIRDIWRAAGVYTLMRSVLIGRSDQGAGYFIDDEWSFLRMTVHGRVGFRALRMFGTWWFLDTGALDVPGQANAVLREAASLPSSPLKVAA